MVSQGFVGARLEGSAFASRVGVEGVDRSEDGVRVESRSTIVGVEIGDDIAAGRRPIVLRAKQCEEQALQEGNIG